MAIDRGLARLEDCALDRAIQGEERKHDTEAILDHTNAKIEKMKERRAARKENRGPSEETLRHTSLRLPPRPSKVFAHGR
ncbi:MAG: hypothetical protein P8Y48_08545 [Novosphingobium sp.]